MTLKWDYARVAAALSLLNSASGQLGDKSVSAPAGCGWSQADAEPAVAHLQEALSRLCPGVSSISEALSKADKNMRYVDEQNGRSTPRPPALSPPPSPPSSPAPPLIQAPPMPPPCSPYPPGYTDPSIPVIEPITNPITPYGGK